MTDRKPRYRSPVLGQLSPHGLLASLGGSKSILLLDLSLEGFKLEFTQPCNIKIGSKHYLKIPLSPLGIHALPYFESLILCKWFTPSNMRMGGVFINMPSSQLVVMENIIEILKDAEQF